MAKQKFDQQLAALEDLRQSPASPSTTESLRKALANRNNFIVAKASKIAAELGLKELIPDLLAALDRFFTDPVKSDPQCWAKKALFQAFADLGHNQADVYVRGLKHIQMEPVWGGQQDTAAPVRGACALALVECRDVSDIALLGHLIEALADTDKTVRVEAARAIGRIDRPEAALLLRLRALVGDEEPEVLGACFSALLSIEGRAGIAFVSRFLEAKGDEGAEAALAIGLMRTPEAHHALKEKWEHERESEFAGVLLSAIALTRQPEAIDFLVDLIATDSSSAPAARAALDSAGLSPDQLAQVEAAVERKRNTL